MKAVHQFVPTLAPRDAVGTHYLGVQAVLREAGYRSEIYALEAKDEFRKLARPYRSFANGRARSNGRLDDDTWLLYHSSVGSPVADFVAQRPEPLIIDYHNITPPSFFYRWEPVVAGALSLGRRQLARLATQTRLGLADSTFNAQELSELGVSATAVVPILLDIGALDRVDPDASVLAHLSGAARRGGKAWLFVGRLAPNKAQHDVVKAFAAYRRFHDPNGRLYLVGGSSSHSYRTALLEFVDALGLSDAVEFTGPVSDGALRAYYEACDVLVVCSDHEGFCVPLLEAMHRGLPIVAYASTAVPETVGDAALVLDSKRPDTVAAAAARLIDDDSLRRGLVDAGVERLAEFSLERSRQKLLDAITSVVGAA
jgi:glycosyltransferase involved in cell wall biosynthesis